MSVEISNLPELVAQLTTSDFTPVVHNGTTYKHKAASYFVRKSENETITGVKTFSSSPIVPTATTGNQAVNKTQMDAIVKPLSDLNRVVQINGDGVPMIPDNAAGTLQKYNFFTNVAGFYFMECTASLENNRIKLAITASNWAIMFPTLATFTNALVTVGYQAPAGRQVRLYTAGSGGNILSTQIATGSKQVISGYNTVSNTYVTLNCAGYTVGDIVYIDFEYIGSGLYDTPVYDKACCNRATNYGALPVPGSRGMGLQFLGNGACPIMFNGPVIGVTGTIRLKFKTSAVLSGGYYFGNYNGSIGINLYQNNLGATSFAGNSIGDFSPSTEYAYSLYFSATNLYVYRNGVLAYTYALSTPLTVSTSNLCISRNIIGTDGQDFTLYSFEYVAEAETLDSHIRFVNGDDAVDSQQKSSTGTPHAMAVYGANGELKAHAGATVIDSSNIYSYVRPIGDVYFQGPNDADPATLYPGTIWTDVSWEEANMTRRVAGSLAGARFTGVPARLTVTVSGGVPTIAVTSGGSGYLSGGNGTLPLTITGACSTQMVATANVTSGVIVSITVNTAGVGYTSDAVAVYDRVAGHGDLTQRHRHQFSRSLTPGSSGSSISFGVDAYSGNQYIPDGGGVIPDYSGAVRGGVETSGAWVTVTKWRRTA